MMLAPVYLLDGYNGNIGEDTDYILAQKDGYFGRDCSRYHHDCPASLFSVSFGLFTCKHLSKECLLLFYIFGPFSCWILLFLWFQYVDGNDYGDYAYGGSSYANYTHDYPYPDHSENEIF